MGGVLWNVVEGLILLKLFSPQHINLVHCSYELHICFRRRQNIIFEGNKMKKLSSVLVLMLIALMMFVSCNNNTAVKERPATTEDATILDTIGSGAISTAIDAFSGKFDPAKINGISMSEDGKVITFNNFKITNSSTQTTVILYGTYQTIENGFCLDLTTGTQLNGKGHTLYCKVTYNESTKQGLQEIIVDGYKLTGLDKIQK